MRNWVNRNAVVGRLQQLHRDEAGMETVQIIMIMAIAAMVLMGVNKVTGVSLAGDANGGLFQMVTSGLGKLFGGGVFSGIGDAIGGLF